MCPRLAFSAVATDVGDMQAGRYSLNPDVRFAGFPLRNISSSIARVEVSSRCSKSIIKLANIDIDDSDLLLPACV
eukprot:2437863-Pyramimonas_sp.AAC.1